MNNESLSSGSQEVLIHDVSLRTLLRALATDCIGRSLDQPVVAVDH